MTVAERENISPVRLILKKTTLNWARLHVTDRRFNGLEGLRIHKARCCQQRNFPVGKYKSFDGLMNLDYTLSVQDSIVEGQRPGEIINKPRIQWPQGNQKATWTNLDQELSFTVAKNRVLLDNRSVLLFFCFVFVFVCLFVCFCLFVCLFLFIYKIIYDVCL